MFVFGKLIGTGNDYDHFQCGFTSLKLLRRVEYFNNGGVFHLDATYKIIKHCFPLIIFGFTDVSRQFYPVCYMFTSHETTIDYINFFKALLDAFSLIGVTFEPEYMIIDASNAMANAIKKIFPRCIILMCWFHLKQNLRKHKEKCGLLYKQTMKDVDALHQCSCSASYKVIIVTKNFQ